jgi:hypothetical protein
LNRHGPIEDFPARVLGDQRDLALLFKTLATLRTDVDVFDKTARLQWKGPTAKFDAWVQKLQRPRLGERSLQAKTRVA